MEQHRPLTECAQNDLIENLQKIPATFRVLYERVTNVCSSTKENLLNHLDFLKNQSQQTLLLLQIIDLICRWRTSTDRGASHTHRDDSLLSEACGIVNQENVLLSSQMENLFSAYRKYLKTPALESDCSHLVLLIRRIYWLFIRSHMEIIRLFQNRDLSVGVLQFSRMWYDAFIITIAEHIGEGRAVNARDAFLSL